MAGVTGSNWKKRDDVRGDDGSSLGGEDPRLDRHHRQRRIQLRNAMGRHHTSDTGRTACDVSKHGLRPSMMWMTAHACRHQHRRVREDRHPRAEFTCSSRRALAASTACRRSPVGSPSCTNSPSSSVRLGAGVLGRSRMPSGSTSISSRDPGVRWKRLRTGCGNTTRPAASTLRSFLIPSIMSDGIRDVNRSAGARSMQVFGTGPDWAPFEAVSRNLDNNPTDERTPRRGVCSLSAASWLSSVTSRRNGVTDMRPRLRAAVNRPLYDVGMVRCHSGELVP